jgi:hypothetical protein
MAIIHRLHLQTSMTPKEVEKLLLTNNLELEQLENNGGLDGLGIWITLRESNSLSKEITSEDYGFTPDVSIGFRMALSESETEGMKITAKACAILLAQGNGDAVFFLNSDYIVFKRLNGELIVYKEISEWLMPELNNNGINYKTEKSEYSELYA